MGLLDTVLGGLLGGGSSGASPIGPILSQILGGQGGAAGGLGGLLQQFTQAGHGNTANSWVGNGPNQPIEPGALGHVFGQDQVNQWSQQTGMAPHDLLGQLAQYLPQAVNSMTPNGQVPTSHGSQGDASPFDGPGMP